MKEVIAVYLIVIVPWLVAAIAIACVSKKQEHEK